MNENKSLMADPKSFGIYHEWNDELKQLEILAVGEIKACNEDQYFMAAKKISEEKLREMLK